MSERRYIVLADNPKLPFSDAVMAGDTLYISGRLGIEAKTGRVPADMDEEMALLLDGFERVLAAADMTWADLVSATVFCPDLSLFDRFNAAYKARFRGDFPARAFIGSGPLLLGAHFEMLGVAVRR